MKLLTSRKFIIGLGIITLTLLVVSIIYRRGSQLPKVLSTDPLNNSTSVDYFDTIDVVFGQPIDITKLTSSSVPAEDWIFSQESSNAVRLKSKQYLKVNQQYTLNLFYDGNLTHTLSFKTVRQQSDPRYVQEVNNKMANDYPLATKLPHESSIFTIRYSSPLTIEITIKNTNFTSQEIIDEVKSWITQNGGDADSHKYVIATPSPSP